MQRFIRVLAFPEAPQPRTRDPKTIVPTLPQLPEGFTAEGGARKFIVLTTPTELIVAFGPDLTSAFGHYHRDIHTAYARMEGSHSEATISGGGYIRFTVHANGRTVATLNDSSGDFGVYDPAILTGTARAGIAEALGIRVQFEWNG